MSTAPPKAERRHALTALPRADDATSEPNHASVSGSVLQAKALIVVSTVLRSIGTLLLTPLMIYHLGSTEYGLWIVVTTITMYASLSESGLGQTVVNKIGEAYATKNFLRIRQIMATAHVLYWLIVAPLALASAIAIYCLPVAEFCLSPADAAYRPLFRLALSVSIGLALVRIPYLVYPGLLIGVQRLPTRVSWEIAATTVSLIATAAALFAGAGLVTVLVVTNVSMLLMTVAIGYSSSRSGVRAKLDLKNFAPRMLAPLATNSCFFFLINATGVIDRNVAIMLIPRLDSLAAAPPYFLLVSVLRVACYALISAGPRALQPFVIQWWARGEKKRLLQTLSLAMRALTLVAALAVMAFAPFASVFIDTWLGSDCYPGNAVLAMTAGAFMLDAYTCSPILFLISMNRQRKLSVVLLMKSVLTIGLSIGMGLGFEDPLLGLAAGAFLASLLPAFCVPSLIRSALGRWPKGVVLRPLLFTLAAPATASVLASPFPTSARLAIVPLSVIVAASVAWLLALEPSDRAAIRSYLGRLKPRSNDLGSTHAE